MERQEEGASAIASKIPATAAVLKTGARVARETFAQIRRAQLLTIASSLAYTTLLSIIPALAVSFAIFQAFGGMNRVYGAIEPFILENLAQGSGAEAVRLLHRFIDNAHASVVGLSGLAGLVVTSMSMLSSIEKAINHAWGVKVSRGFFQRVTAYWLFISLGPMALSVGVGLVTTSDLPLSRLFPSGTGMFLLLAGVFFCVYKWVPHARVRTGAALIAAIYASALLHAARFLYGEYVKHFVNYDRIYGSLGAVPILMVWVYVLWVVVLSGAALTSAVQTQTGR